MSVETSYDPRTGTWTATSTPARPATTGASIQGEGTPSAKKRGFWDFTKDPFGENNSGWQKVGNIAWDVLPVDNAVRMGEEVGKGHWGEAAKNLGIGAVDTVNLLTLGTGSAATSGVRGAIQGFRAAKGLTGGARAAQLGLRVTNPATIWGNLLQGAGFPILGTFLRKDKPDLPGLYSGTPTVPAASAADFRRFESGNKPVKTAEELAAEQAAKQAADAKARREQIARELGIAGGTLAPLTPEQINAIAEQERMAQRQYDDLLNQYLLQERQGRLGKEAAVGQARREAAGQGQDISTQLAAMGMDVSPGSALSGETAVFQGQQAREAAAIRSLADILAQAASGRTNAKSALEAALSGVNKERAMMQTANTQANLDRYLAMIAGQ